MNRDDYCIENYERIRPWFEPSILFFFTFLCSVLFINSPGTEDVSVWISWMDGLSRNGLFEGYSELHNMDYPHLVAAILWGATKVATVTGVNALVALKCILALSAVASVVILFSWLKSALFALALLFLIMFNLSLGYLDVLYLPFLLLSLWELHRVRWTSAAIFFAISCSIKWQPLIAGPFLILYIFLPDWRAGLRHVAPSFFLVILSMAPFGMAVITSFARALSHDALSANALNLLWLFSAAIEYHGIHGISLRDGLVHPLPGAHSKFLLNATVKLSLITFYGILVWQFIRGEQSFERMLLFATAGFLTYFALNTGVHENHLYTACVLGLLLGYFVPPLRFLSAMILALNAINLILFYGLSGTGLGFSRVYGVDISVFFALVMLAVCACYWWVAITTSSIEAPRQTRGMAITRRPVSEPVITESPID